MEHRVLESLYWRAMRPGMVDLVEIGQRASWYVTSAKPGYGVENMRTEDLTTYWQSDGHQPHLIDIKFPYRIPIAEVHFYLDHRNDESYTPKRISIRGGSYYGDLKDIIHQEFPSPNGWEKVPIRRKTEDESDPSLFQMKLMQIAILGNHQNGRDTRIRQIRVFSPKRPAAMEFMDWHPDQFLEPASSSSSSRPSRARRPRGE